MSSCYNWPAETETSSATVSGAQVSSGSDSDTPYVKALTFQHRQRQNGKALRPARHKIGHLGDVLPSQSLELVLKNYIKPT